MYIQLVSLPTLLAFFLNFFVLMLILTYDYKGRKSHIFSVLIAFIVLWNAFEFVMFNTASPERALLIARLVWTSVAMIMPCFLNFALLFPRENKVLKNKLIYLLIYAPALVTLYFVWSSDLLVAGTAPRLFGGARAIVYGPFLEYFAIYAYINFAIGLYLFCNTWRKSNIKREKMQAKWFLSASLIPIVIGSITNLLLPTMHIAFFPLAGPLTTLMCLMIVNAIIKYRILSVTPKIAADTIISMLPHAIILLSKDQKILYGNKKLFEALGYTKTELSGEPVKKILHEDERIFGLPWQTVSDTKVVEKSKVKFLAKNRDTVLFNFSGAVAIEDDDIIGFIGLGTLVENNNNEAK